MSNRYHEKQQRKQELYEQRLQKAEQQSETAHQIARQIMQQIPPGQPILVGHHSEKRHRRDLHRVDILMKKSIDESNKAEYYRRKLANVTSDATISSDDPDAIDKLQEKLTERMELQEVMKDANKQARKSDSESPYKPYQLQNNNANIRRIRQRIEELKRKKSDVTTVLHDDGFTKLVDNVEENRLQVFFPSIPDAETRTELKRNGFRWSRYNKCWQRFRSKYATYIAKKILHIE
jgi:hypothetical protein